MSLDGILLVDKPGGWTSHDVVAKVRGLSGQRRVGHTGTLDPAATGLLVLCLGRATRLVEYMVDHHKSYEGVIRLGLATDTDDLEGTVIDEQPVPPLDAAALGQLERRFTGTFDQVPPAYSAVHVQGRRAYELARRGRPVELAPRTVRIESLELAVRAPGQLAVSVTCSAGTYVRSLARDVGRELGCGGALAELRRTAVGGFRVSAARPLDELVDVGDVRRFLWPPDEGILDRGAAIIGAAKATGLANGSRVEVATNDACDALRLYNERGGFIGIGSLAEGVLRPRKILARNGAATAAGSDD